MHCWKEQGKEMCVSGNICRDVSCFVFKEIENKGLGIMFTSKNDDIEVQIIVIAFVDNSDFFRME